MADLTSFYRGDTVPLAVSFSRTGIPEDITGHIVTLTLKATMTDPDPGAVQVQVVCPPGAESDAGTVTITIGSDQSKLLSPGTYFYDVQKVIPGSPPIVQTAVSGNVTVMADVTLTDS